MRQMETRRSNTHGIGDGDHRSHQRTGEEDGETVAVFWNTTHGLTDSIHWRRSHSGFTETAQCSF